MGRSVSAEVEEINSNDIAQKAIYSSSHEWPLFHCLIATAVFIAISGCKILNETLKDSCVEWLNHDLTES